jgi:hypothetical protein
MGSHRPLLLAAALTALLASPAAAHMDGTVHTHAPHTAALTGLPPQVLGLVAHATPIPLTCEGGTCTALVSSFCLQEDRPAPTEGQSYETAGSGDVTIVVTDASGAAREFSGAGLLTYVSEGDFTRTRISIDETRLAALDGAEVAVRIAPMVSLLPVMESDLPAAVVQADLDTALGAARFAAEGFFRPGTPRSDAAVTMTRMINRLPAAMSGGTDPNAIDPAKRQALWDHVKASGGLDGLSPEGVDRARGELDRCGAFAEMGFKLTLRGCLESSHDRTMREVNDEFWDAEVGY